jgi:hypothetical protein
MSFVGLKFKLVAPTDVTVPAKKLQSLDSRDYVVDDVLGFAYRRPNSPPWSAPVALHGFPQLLKSQGIDVPALIEELKKTSVGRMILASESIRVTSGRPTVIRETTSSRTGLHFRNSFAVEAYDKSLLGRVKVSLAAFAVNALQITSSGLEKLATSGTTIVATASFHARHVLVDGRAGDFDVYHGYLFAESKQRFYVVEFVYSPQTHEARDRLHDLQTMLQSFQVR